MNPKDTRPDFWNYTLAAPFVIFVLLLVAVVFSFAESFIQSNMPAPKVENPAVPKPTALNNSIKVHLAFGKERLPLTTINVIAGETAVTYVEFENTSNKTVSIAKRGSFIQMDGRVISSLSGFRQFRHDSTQVLLEKAIEPGAKLELGCNLDTSVVGHHSISASGWNFESPPVQVNVFGKDSKEANESYNRFVGTWRSKGEPGKRLVLHFVRCVYPEPLGYMAPPPVMRVDRDRSEVIGWIGSENEIKRKGKSIEWPRADGYGANISCDVHYAVASSGYSYVAEMLGQYRFTEGKISVELGSGNLKVKGKEALGCLNEAPAIFERVSDADL